MYLVDSMPRLAVTTLSFAGPQGQFAGMVLGEIFGFLMPSNVGPSTEDIVLMAVRQLEDFIEAQFDDVEVRNAAAKIKTTYNWFKRTFDRAKTDRAAVTRDSPVIMSQINDALGPNSILDEGINMLSDPRFRYLGINTLCFGIGLKMTLMKIQIQANNDASLVPAVMEEITGYIETIEQARRDAEAYMFRQMSDLPQGSPTDEDKRIFRERRDALVQKVYQGDASVPGTARALLNRALYAYEQWPTV